MVIVPKCGKSQTRVAHVHSFSGRSRINQLPEESHVPAIHVEMFEGRTLEQKRAFVEAVTRVTCETLGTKPETVDIIITDISRENWATAGKLWSDPRG